MHFKALCTAGYLLLRIPKQTLLAMKLTVLLIAVSFCANAESFAQKVTLSLKKAPLEQVFNQVKLQTGFSFIWDESTLKRTHPVDIHVKNAPIAEVMDHCLKGQSLVYQIVGKIIVIKLEAEIAGNTGTIPNVMLAPLIDISGKVTNSQNEPMEGVSVMVKGAQTGVTTNADGQFRLSVSSANVELIFSFVGYQSRTIKVGNQTVFNIVMEESVAGLNEVIVTALGFKENQDKLGSSSSKISSKSINNSGEAGLLNKMAGKASGVFIGKSSGSDPGGGSFVQIRGASTLSGNFEPLYIIDGVPMSSSVIGGTSYAGVIQQSRVNDINPDDIASIQILKGASASALWGSRAANGVVVITTKDGAYNERMKISFKTTYSIDKVNLYQKKQTKYGQGAVGIYSPSSQSSWGDKIEDRSGGEDEVNKSGQYFKGYETGNLYYPIIKKNSRENFAEKQFDEIFHKGYFLDNNINISGGGPNSNYLFSASDLYQQGVFRNSSDYRRSSIRLNIESRLNNIIKLSTNAAYTKTLSNRVQRSNNLAGMMLGYYRMPTDFDITDYIGDYYTSSTASPVINRHRSYRNYLGSTNNPVYNNPLWTMNEQKNPNNVSRFIGSAEITVAPVEWFEFIARGGVDNYTDNRATYFPVYSATQLNGSYDEQIIRENQMNLDLIGRFKRDFGEISSNLTVGFNLNDRKNSMLGGNMTDFLIANGPINFSNAQGINRNPYNSITNIRSSRGYALLGLSAYNALFLNLSYAAESASTFGAGSNNTFFYPSADIAWQFSKLALFEGSPVLSFGKLRFSYGVVGVQPQPYQTSTVFVSGNSLFGNGAYLQSSKIGSNLLKPEKKTEYEAGLDMRFSDNRLSAGITYYRNYVENLLLQVPIAISTGFSTIYKNIGKMQNKGIELDLGYSIIRKNDLSVSVSGNFSANRNLVTDLAGASSVQVGGIGGFMANYAVEGEPIGIFMGGHRRRDENGKPLFDANGFPLVDGANGKIGDPNPDWRGGFGAEARYKNFSLSILFETSQGGDFYDGTRSVMYTFGTHPDIANEITTDRDLKNFKGNSIPKGTVVRGNMIDLGAGPVLADEFYYTTQGGGQGSDKEQFVVDGSWTRLRDVSLSYSLRTESFRRATKLQSIEFKLSGRNLLLWTGLKNVDPDLNQTQVTLGRGVDYFENPGARSYLFSILFNY